MYHEKASPTKLFRLNYAPDFDFFQYCFCKFNKDVMKYP